MREAHTGNGDADMAEMARHDLLGFLERAVATSSRGEPVSLTTASLVHAASEQPPDIDRDLIGSFLDSARSMGGRI